MSAITHTHEQQTGHLSRARRTASALLLVVGVTGCAAEQAAGEEDLVDSEEDAAEVLAYSTSASAQSNAEIFGVSKGERDMRLKPVSTHECFLTRISGELDDEYSMVALHHSTNDAADDLEKLYGFHVLNDNGDTWKLWTANGGSNSLSAQATCVPHSDFILDPEMVIWSAPKVWTQTHGYMTQSRLQLWNADAVASLTGLQGDFNGGGESVEVITAPQPNLPSVYLMKNERGVFMQGAARSFYVGHPGRTSMWRTANFSSSGNKKTKLIPTNEGVCYLTRFSGDFNGSEERVRIMPQMDEQGREWWVFETHEGRGKAYGSAQCIYYDQREGCAGPGVPCI
jgi:hypothetical protein